MSQERQPQRGRKEKFHVSVQERNETIDEVLLKPVKRQVASLEQLLDRCLPMLAARLWATCGWPESMAEGWKVGDFNFLVLETRPEPDASIYIQFWSEPHEPVSAEVGSGEWSPGTLKYLRAERRRQLKAFGFEIGGRAKNWRSGGSRSISTASRCRPADTAR